jgi:hypothetical protein
MKEIVYIETSFVSLLVADPSRDVSVAGNQQVSRDWWRWRRAAFACVTSDETLMEAARGNTRQVQLRLEALAGLPSLPTSSAAAELALRFLATRRQGRCRASRRGHSCHGGLFAHLELPPSGECADSPPLGPRGYPARLEFAKSLHSVGVNGRMNL